MLTYNQFNEGKAEEEEINRLIDKGLANLTPEEKELLDKLSKGGSLPDDPKTRDRNIDLGNGIGLRGKIEKAGDEDVDYLNNILGGNYGSDTGFYNVMPEDPDNIVPFEPPAGPVGTAKFNPGDAIVFRRGGSEHDGKTGKFIKMREDGKYSIKFDEDGKRLAAFAKNVYSPNDPLPEPKKPKQAKQNPPEPIRGYPDIHDYNDDIPEEGSGWGPGAFDVPDSFYDGLQSGKGKKEFKKGDKIIYKNSKSDHNNKSGVFLEVRPDGKYSVRFDDGIKFAGKAKNFQPYGIEMKKEDFIVKVGNYLDENGKTQIAAFILLDNGDKCDGQDILAQFPELMNVGFDDGDNDEISYLGDLTKEEIVMDLEERDFRVELADELLF